MKKLIFQYILCMPIFACAQMEDFQWPLGYDGGSAAGIQNTVFDFRENKVKFEFKDLSQEFVSTTAYACTSDSGKFLFYSNGCEIINSNRQLIENGDSIIEPGYLEFCVNQGFYRVEDGAVALNWPGVENLYAIVQVGLKYVFQPTFKAWHSQLSFTKIDMAANSGLGKVLLKNKSIIMDSLTGSMVEAVRHANGRDWWIIKSKDQTNKYYFFIFNSNGFSLHHEQFIGPICRNYQHIMQAAFSPDGTKYAKSYSRDTAWLFDFDRCSGYLSDFRELIAPGTPLDVNPVGLGTCFSQNSRYLYVSNLDFIHQFDMQASNINSSRIAVIKYIETGQPGLKKWYSRMERGPDGKIYINIGNGSKTMHIMHNPDAAGLDCEVEPDAVDFASGYFNWGLPNQPNWRLGPIDGSSCDTLGIDNIPWAHWRWRADYVEPLKVHFRDLAGFEPTDWLWDFGDGQTSAEKSPIHDYASAGEYTVCCTVSNQFGQDSMCRLVKISTVLTQEPFSEKEIKAAPNPTSGPFKLYFSEPIERESLFELFDISGKTVFSKSVSKNVIAADFDFSNLPNGLYFWRLSSGGVHLASGKMAKIRP